MSRCLIYKVHTALQRREFILPHRFGFVKNFFQVFQNFFSSQPARRAAPLFRAALAGDSYRLPHLVSLVKNFFRTFQVVLFSHPRYFVVATAVSRTALIEYHSLPLLSTPFLEFFQVFSEGGKSRSGRGISALFFSILSSPI